MKKTTTLSRPGALAGLRAQHGCIEWARARGVSFVKLAWLAGAGDGAYLKQFG